MAEKNNATCSICGKGYYMCLSCRDSANINPWKIHTDTAEHYKVFQIIRGYNTNVYTKDEAKNKLRNVDLSDLNSFRPHIKQIVEDILKEEKIVETVVEAVEEKIVVDNIQNIERATYPRKKNHKGWK